MITYPNQKIVHINKSDSNNFLQVDKDAWITASNELKYGTFKVYLYLAGNQDGFDLALSQKAITDSLGLSENTYHRAIKELIDKKYLVISSGNTYNFYLYPCMSTVCTHARVHNVPADEYSMYPHMGREIYKIDKKDNNIYKEKNSFSTPSEEPVKRKYESFRYYERQEIYSLYCDDFLEPSELAARYKTTSDVINKIIEDTEFSNW